MKTTTLLLFAFFYSALGYSQEYDVQFKIDSIEKSFTYEHGTIELRNGIGQIIIPEGFKYLNPIQSERVLVDLYGNPNSTNLTLGMIIPEEQGVLSNNGYVFNIQYDEIGYVKDNDADDINYDDLIKQMQEEAEEANKERQKQGYVPISIIGWASKPFYDKEKKILHWAKEIKFGNEEVNTLNYNIRVLGRKGVLVLNAIATMQNLSVVQNDMHKVLNIVQFNDGYKYKDFDPSLDQVAVWTIGGLVAGKVLTKVGLFAVILKFWKIIAIAVIAFFGGFWKKIKWKKEKKNSQGSEIPKQIEDNTKQLSENSN